jgi:small neutral amino acid transporter SnatA (MarC family)
MAMVTSPSLKRVGALAGILTPRSLTLLLAMLALGAAAPAASAHAASAANFGPRTSGAWSFAEAFTFLFVTLGPLNVIGPFLAMTRGESTAFRRRVAFKSSLIAVSGLLVVAAIGGATLRAWGISVGALLLTGGAILVLVALRPVLAGYSPRETASKSAFVAVPAKELAFSPLAFPTIITPYGLALLVLLFTLYPVTNGGLWILATAGLVLVFDLLVMLAADRIATIPLIDPALDILGCVMNVLLIALGAQAVGDGLRLITQQAF